MTFEQVRWAARKAASPALRPFGSAATLTLVVTVLAACSTAGPSASTSSPASTSSAASSSTSPLPSVPYPGQCLGSFADRAPRAPLLRCSPAGSRSRSGRRGGPPGAGPLLLLGLTRSGSHALLRARQARGLRRRAVAGRHGDQVARHDPQPLCRSSRRPCHGDPLSDPRVLGLRHCRRCGPQRRVRRADRRRLEHHHVGGPASPHSGETRWCLVDRRRFRRWH